MTTAALDRVLAEASVVVCCGSGGVGKTTVSGCLALHAAHLGRRAVVVTIDPAKRLADALGLPEGLTNDPERVDVGDLPGELWAMMLDTETTFDGLVRQYATHPTQVERILSNRFYRNIAGGLSGTQDYMAAEKLHELHTDERFDIVVVDTPPSRNALDFLHAPATLTRFIDHPLFRMVMLPARRGLRVVNLAAQPMLRSIGRVVGGDTLADALAFFQAFAGMEHGFRQRAEEVQTLLHAGSTEYLLVAAPRADTAAEALYFASQLREAGLSTAVLVLNRLQPTFGADDDPRAGAEVASSAAVEAQASGEHDLAAAWGNLAELRALAALELDGLRDLLAEIGSSPVVRVPLLPTDVHDVEGLEQVRAHLVGRARSGTDEATPPPGG